MKKNFLSLIALMLIVTGLNAQTTFQRKLYTATSLINNANIITANGNEYLITGELGSTGNAIVVALLDASGITKWSKYFINNNYNFSVIDAVQTKDSGFVISCQTYDQIVGVLKVNKLGNLLWSEIISDDSLSFAGYYLNPGGDGSVLISGSSSNTSRSPAFLMKLNDADGSLQWAQTFSGIGGNKKYSDGSIEDVTIDNNGNYLVTGSWEYFDSSITSKTAGFIAKFSSTGNYGGSRFYSTGASLSSVIKADADNYIFAGGVPGITLYLKANDKGNIVWAKQIVNADATHISNVAAGTNNTYTFLGENFFANINNDGSLNWFKKPKHYTKLNFTGLAKTPDGGYASVSKKFLSHTDSAFIIKVDGNGNTCNGVTSKIYVTQNVQIPSAPITGAATRITSQVKITPGGFKSSDKPFFNTRFCSDQAGSVVSKTNTDDVNGNNLSVFVSPNPVKTMLNWQVKNVQSAQINITITITNVQGNIFYEQKFTTINNTQHNSINISSLTPDIYILKITDGKQQKFVKFIKE
ncbi:MAG: T9SS type A sorting domain-containing protein [Parafilimonas sp.]